MRYKIKTLEIHEEITSGQEVADTFVPANGKNVKCLTMSGDAAFTPNAVIKAVWKWNHSTEEEVIIWSTKGSLINMPLNYTITDADGVRKLAIVCENSEDAGLVLSGKLKFKVED